MLVLLEIANKTNKSSFLSKHMAKTKGVMIITQKEAIEKHVS